MPAVHCIKEWCELKCNRYRLRPAVLILRMFWRGCSSFDLVGNDSIWEDVSSILATCNKSQGLFYHLDRGISQVDELGKHLALLPSGIQFRGVP
jgi:hypothetical protein